MKKLTKFISLFSIIIFCLFLTFHIFLNIFIKSKEVKVDEKELLNKTAVFLTDRQIEIASYILNNQQNPKFNNYIFLFFDTFSNRNQVAYLTAQIYINELDFSNKIKNIERQIIELSTKRYITKILIINYAITIYFHKPILEIINMDLKMEASIISKKTIKISLKKNL